MRIDHGGIEPVLHGELLQLCGNATCRDSFPLAVDKDESRRLVTRVQPCGRLVLELGWDVDSPHFSAFGVEIDETD